MQYQNDKLVSENIIWCQFITDAMKQDPSPAVLSFLQTSQSCSLKKMLLACESCSHKRVHMLELFLKSRLILKIGLKFLWVKSSTHTET